MERSSISNRLSLLPRRHLFIALGIAAVLGAGGWLYAPFAPQRYAASAVYSYDRDAVAALAAQQGHEITAAQLAESVVSERMKSWQPAEGAAQESGFDPAHSHLKVTTLPGAGVGLEWSGDDPSETTAIATQFSSALANWAPKDSGYLPVKAATAPTPHPSKQIQASSPRPATASVPATPPANGNLSDQAKLKANVAGIDARIYRLSARLAEMRREGATAAPATSTTGASLNAGAEALHQRNEVEEQIGDLRKQRYFLLQKAEASGLSVANLQLPTHGQFAPPAAAVKSVPPPAPAPAKTALPEPLNVPAGLSSAQSAERVFTLDKAPSTSRPVTTLGTLAGWLGVAAGLLVAAIYFGVLLWRFRPIHSESMLRDLLPRDVICLGGLEGRI